MNEWKGRGKIHGEVKLDYVGQNKTPKAAFKVAIPRERGQGEDRVPVVAWEELAEEVKNTTQEGTEVEVTGSISVRNWKDRQEKWNTTFEVNASGVTVISGGLGGEPNWTDDDDVPF